MARRSRQQAKEAYYSFRYLCAGIGGFVEKAWDTGDMVEYVCKIEGVMDIHGVTVHTSPSGSSVVMETKYGVATAMFPPGYEISFNMSSESFLPVWVSSLRVENEFTRVSGHFPVRNVKMVVNRREPKAEISVTSEFFSV